MCYQLPWSILNLKGFWYSRSCLRREKSAEIEREKEKGEGNIEMKRLKDLFLGYFWNTYRQ
jgi:hypothetical protein